MHFHAKSIEVAQVQYSSNTELKHMQTLETIQSISIIIKRRSSTPPTNNSSIAQPNSLVRKTYNHLVLGNSDGRSDSAAGIAAVEAEAEGTPH